MAASSNSVADIPQGRWWATDNEDAMWLTVFPAEIWQRIVNSVTDPAAMYNMAKASTFLELFLEPQKRTLYLFYPVLKIHDLGDQSTGLQNRKPNLCDYLRTNELLKCRLVCSGWTQAVNSFLESRPHHFTVSTTAPLPITERDALVAKIPVPQDRLEDPAYPAHFRLQDFTGGGPNMEAQLLAQMRSSYYSDNPTDPCPSPTRHLEIMENDVRQRVENTLTAQEGQSVIKAIRGRKQGQRNMATQGGGPPPPPVPRPPSIDNNWRFIRTFLEQVGRSFHHLTIQADLYRTVQEYVELIPNLRSLYIIARTTWRAVDMVTPSPP